MPAAYVTRASLAAQLEIGESTVDDLVRRGVLPRPVRLSSGTVRWRWESVDRALRSMEGGVAASPEADIDEGVKRALQAAKTGSDRRSA